MQYLLIIKHPSTYHFLSLGRGFGVWGFGVMGLSVFLAGCHTRMIACVLLSPPSYRELSFVVGMSVHARGRSYPREESFIKEFQALHHMDGLEVIII